MAEENSKDQIEGNPLNNPDEQVEEKIDYKMITEEIKEEIEECFDIFDKDKDGQISYAELGTLLRWLKFNPKS